MKRHIPAPWEWTTDPTPDRDVAIIFDSYPEQTIDEVDSDVTQASYLPEPPFSEASTGSYSAQASSRSHGMRTRTRTAKEQGRERRPFHHYDYSSHTTTEDELDDPPRNPSEVRPAQPTTIAPVAPSLITPSDLTPNLYQPLVELSKHPLLNPSFSPSHSDITLPPLFIEEEGGILAENTLLFPSDQSTKQRPSVNPPPRCNRSRN